MSAADVGRGGRRLRRATGTVTCPRPSRLPRLPAAVGSPSQRGECPVWTAVAEVGRKDLCRPSSLNATGSSAMPRQGGFLGISLPLQVLVFFHKLYAGLFFLVSLVLFGYKGPTAPSPRPQPSGRLQPLLSALDGRKSVAFARWPRGSGRGPVMGARAPLAALPTPAAPAAPQATSFRTPPRCSGSKLRCSSFSRPPSGRGCMRVRGIARVALASSLPRVPVPLTPCRSHLRKPLRAKWAARVRHRPGRRHAALSRLPAVVADLRVRGRALHPAGC